MKGWRAFLAATMIALSATGCDTTGQSHGVRDAGDVMPISDIAANPNAGGLDNFFDQLIQLRTGKRSQLRIVQIGDSHTAADFFTGQLRTVLQSEYGNAGIGTRAAGLAYAGIRKQDMTITQSNGWQVHNSLTDHDFAPYGIAGFTSVSRVADASMSLTATAPRGFDRGFVDFAQQPYGGTLEIWLDDKLAAKVSTQGPANTPARVSVTAPPGGAHSLRLVARDKGIEILDWNTERNDRGILLDSFGVVGATAGIFENWDQNIVGRQLAALHPALIIVAYGTNEGVRTNFDAGAYAEQYDTLLTQLHRWSPGSSLLVVAPTDGARQAHGCSYCAWTPLPAIDQVRRIQYQVALKHRAAYWDSSEPELRSGGIGQWVRMNPPLARPDHIHFTIPGYTILANEFYYWLNYAFSLYTKAHPRRSEAL